MLKAINILGRLFSHAAVFFLAYILLLLPTYYLPYVGSNSAVLAGLGAATGFGFTPQFWMHVFCLYFMIVVAWLRGCQIGKQWIAVFPAVAAIFDMVPGINLIPLVPTVMHILALILGARGATDKELTPAVPALGALVSLIGGSFVVAGTIHGFAWQERLEKGNRPMTGILQTPAPSARPMPIPAPATSTASARPMPTRETPTPSERVAPRATEDVNLTAGDGLGGIPAPIDATPLAQEGEVTAESLLAEAVTLYETGQHADGSVRRGAYEQALLVLDRIVERFPASDLAVQILLGESVGDIDVSNLRQAIGGSASMPAPEVSVAETAVNRAPVKPSSAASENIATAVTRCYASDAVGETDDALVVLRVTLDGSGRLTEPPSLLAPDRISAAERRLMRLASAALQECQPYSIAGESSQVAIAFRAAGVAVATEELLKAAQGSDATTVEPIAAVAPLEAPAPTAAEPRSTPNVQEREDALGLDRNARRDIQRRLVLLGFDTRGVDGMFGPGTRGAIANWQITRGHPNSGFFDRGQLEGLTAQSEIAFQEWSRQQVRVQPQPRTQTGAGSRQASPSGRYLDSRGCLREPDGRYVPNFRANCR